MKFVIITQFMENYGAHDWDGAGSCPQYWKFKGGETYIVEGLSQADAQDFEQNHLHKLTSLICYQSDYVQEYVLSYKLVEDSETVCEDWESPVVVKRDGDVFTATRTSTNDDHGYLDRKIHQKHESYTMLAESKRENYTCNYILKTGQVVSAQDISKHL